MSRSNHQLVRDFFAGLSRGNLPDDLFTNEMTVWTTVSGGPSDKARYQGGVKILQSLFQDGLRYSVDSVTAEDDRVAAEVQGRGRLKNGEDYHNTYVFMFRIRNGRIATVAEHCNPIVVNEKIMPLLQAAMKR
jgi:ketosteroid isomerase-like protein